MTSISISNDPDISSCFLLYKKAVTMDSMLKAGGELHYT